MWGRCEKRAAGLSVSQVSDSVFIPYGTEGGWGIFHQNGAIEPAAIDLHGPDGERDGQPDTFVLPDAAFLPTAADAAYIYGGRLELHYGHFIANTLPRLWPLAQLASRSVKLLFHTYRTAEDWSEHAFIREIFAALAIAPADIVTFSEPTIVPHLIIPHPCFQEQHFTYGVFGELGKTIGRALLGEEPVERNDNPVYLSKTALKSGVGRVVNELEIETVLRARGVDIVHPETLSLQQQVRLFAARSRILAFTGSALHTGFFHKPRGKVVAVSATFDPNSNFRLLDMAGGYQVDYYFPPGAHELGKNLNGFITAMAVTHPELIAEDMLTLIGA